MKLDDKLREVIYGWVTADMDVTEEEHIDKMVAQIKQAFADEGYVDTHLIGDEGDAFYVCHVCGNHVQEKFQQLHATLHDKPELKNYMTGQEWYDRFEKSLPGTVYTGWQREPRNVALEAAKKASGLQ